MTAPDQPAETPMRDHVAKFLDFMAAGGAICIMDIPGDASCTSHTFGGDVSLAVVDFIRNNRAPLAEALAVPEMAALRSAVYEEHGPADLECGCAVCDALAALTAALRDTGERAE